MRAMSVRETTKNRPRIDQVAGSERRDRSEDRDQTNEQHGMESQAEHVILGMAAALAAFFLFTVMNVCAKLLAEDHSVIEIAFWRNLIALAPFLGIALLAPKRGIHRLQAKPGLVIARSVLGALSLMVTFAAFALMPMADTTVLMFTSSLFIPVLGILFLKESVGPWRWGAVVTGFVGVAIMTQPGSSGMALPLLGITLALLASLMHATLQIILRYLGSYEKPLTVTFYFFLIGTVVAALPMPWVGRWPSLDSLPLLLGVGLSGLGAQFCLTIAFKNAQAAIVTVFNYSSIVWATLFGWLIFGEWPLPVVIIGATVVIASNLVMIWRESRVRKLRGDRVRAEV